MNGHRASVLAVLLLVCVGWALFAWLTPPDLAVGLSPGTTLIWHKIISVAAATVLSIHLFLNLILEETSDGRVN